MIHEMDNLFNNPKAAADDTHGGPLIVFPKEIGHECGNLFSQSVNVSLI
jgi:hypothetical protein